jgi:D-glycero-alpha-D-manno-heptose-7-phosphate kinase
MIISKCPLRVSLAGGSTDLIEFVDTYGYGSVISFPIDVYTYISLSLNLSSMYRINYSETEEVKDVDLIKNDVAREVIKYFDLPPVTVVFNSDIPTSGSGLATSSSYTIAFISAVDKLLNLNLSQFDICKLALEIEHKFNPLTGYQDTYGCGIGGLKRLHFYREIVKLNGLDSTTLNKFNMYLVNSNQVRESNKVLSSINLEKSKDLIELVDELQRKIVFKDSSGICDVLNDGWEKKKKTSSLISNEKINELDKRFLLDNSIKGVKLCGAGNGGYFFILSDSVIKDEDFMKIDIENRGVISKNF